MCVNKILMIFVTPFKTTTFNLKPPNSYYTFLSFLSSISHTTSHKHNVAKCKMFLSTHRSLKGTQVTNRNTNSCDVRQINDVTTTVTCVALEHSGVRRRGR